MCKRRSRWGCLLLNKKGRRRYDKNSPHQQRGGVIRFFCYDKSSRGVGFVCLPAEHRINDSEGLCNKFTVCSDDILFFARLLAKHPHFTIIIIYCGRLITSGQLMQYPPILSVWLLLILRCWWWWCGSGLITINNLVINFWLRNIWTLLRRLLHLLLLWRCTNLIIQLM